MRPRFVLALTSAALVVAAVELFAALAPGSAIQRVWAGRVLEGPAARVAAGLHAGLCLTAAWGLWRLRSWGRNVAMAYLGFVLVSFLLWGVRANAEHQLVYVMGWQVFVLPFVVFCLMYLFNGARYFE